MVSKLIEKIQKTKAPICVGLDPMLSYIPEHVTKKAFAEFGETLEASDCHVRAVRSSGTGSLR